MVCGTDIGHFLNNQSLLREIPELEAHRASQYTGETRKVLALISVGTLAILFDGFL